MPLLCPHCGNQYDVLTSATDRCSSCGGLISSVMDTSTQDTAAKSPDNDASTITAGPPEGDSTVSLSSKVAMASETGSLSSSSFRNVTIPGYVIVQELGRGGMGVVYKAIQSALKRTVAVKMIRLATHASDQEITRFQIEAEAVARLQHPNIVQIYDIGTVDGLPYFSLEYVESGTLRESLNSTPQPPLEAAKLLETLARAIHSAHERGIVHRDLKPANVLISSSGVPKITDFGLAKQLDNDSGQTQTGAIMGTPSYMAPEQAAGQIEAIGPATDVYALGAMLYEAITGRPPFKGASTQETLELVRHADPVPPSTLQPRTPRDLETICLKCLAKEPARRYTCAASIWQIISRH